MTTAYFQTKRLSFAKTATVFIYCTLMVLQGYAQGRKPVSGAPETWEYAVVFNSGVQTNLSFFNTAIADTLLNAGMEGLMNISVRKEKNGSHVCCRFTSISKLHLPLPESVKETVNTSLLAEFCFTRHSNGLIDSIFFREAPGDAAEHLIVQFIEGWQYADPGISKQEWTNEFYLSDGKVIAAFKRPARRVLEMDSVQAVYHKPGRHPDLIPQHTVYHSDLRFGFEKENSFPAEVNGFINRQSLISHRLASEMKNSYAYSRKQVISNHFSHGSDSFVYKRPFYYPERVQLLEREKTLQRAASLQSRNIEKALLDINDSPPELDRTRLLEDLKAFFHAEKPISGELESIFLEADPRSARYKLIRAALIGAPTNRAQGIIVKMIRKYRQEDANALRYIVPSAGIIQTPGYALQQELEDLVTDSGIPPARQSSTFLSLGNMAGALTETDIPRADSLVERLILQLKSFNDPMLLLATLGNAGTNNALPAILPYLRDSSETINGMAWYALRFVEHENVDRLYLDAISNGAAFNETVFSFILEALFYRTFRPEAQPHLEKIIQTGSEKLQLQCLQLLCHYSYHHPSLLELIRQIAVSHPNEKVRASAAAFH